MKPFVQGPALLVVLSLAACSGTQVQPAVPPVAPNNLQTEEVDNGPVDAGRPEEMAVPPSGNKSPPTTNEAGNENAPKR